MDPRHRHPTGPGCVPNPDCPRRPARSRPYRQIAAYDEDDDDDDEEDGDAPERAPSVPRISYQLSWCWLHLLP